MADSNYINETMRKLRELFREEDVTHKRTITLDNGQKVIVENKKKEVKYVCR